MADPFKKRRLNAIPRIYIQDGQKNGIGFRNGSRLDGVFRTANGNRFGLRSAVYLLEALFIKKLLKFLTA